MTDDTKKAPTNAPEAGETLVGNLEQELSEQLDELEELVREHPLATLGIAAAAGLLVALILSRR